MISAEAARALLKKHLNDYTEEEIKKVDQAINAAISKGHNFCYCHFILHEDCIDQLKNLGYTVRNLGYTVRNCTTQMDGNEFFISWKDERSKDDTSGN